MNNSFGYDVAGNVTTRRGGNVTYNLNNEVTGGTNYAFDANGNPTVYNGVGKTMAFDQENRMTAYNGVISNGYRSDGLRAWKQNSAGTRTYFLYDLGGRIVCELTSAGAVQAEDTFGPLGLVERSGSGNAIGTGFFGFDPSGNQCLKLTSGGSVTASTIFDSYGNNASSPGSNNPSPFGFGGEFGDYTDTETGFVLCQHRFYDPLKCRWVSRDPIGSGGGTDLYEYGGDDPVGKFDVFGFAWGDWQNNIKATVFGGKFNYNTSAYPPYGVITDEEIGVALPAHVPNGTIVEITNPANGRTIYAKVLDVGPWYDGRPGWPENPYWNNNSRPRAESEHSTNGAGIDLTSGADQALGLPFKPGHYNRNGKPIGQDGGGRVNWRFPCPKKQKHKK